MKIEIKNRFSGEVIFSHDQENNTIKLTVLAAIKIRSNLSGANLAGADLDGAYLAGAYLYRASLAGADLAGSDLNGAYLAEADLSGANLAGANLAGADLDGAYLAGADLSGAVGNMLILFSMQLETYPISFTKEILQIGCERFTHDEWRNFNDDEISEMDFQMLSFWKKWKDFIFMAIELRLGEK